jgi:uncharacterized protein
MELYRGPSSQFMDDAVHDRLVRKLEDAFFEFYGHKTSSAEVRAWRNSLVRMSNVMQAAKLDDHGVLLEYQLPLSSKRLDCMLTGRNDEGHEHAVIVELKQWERCETAEGESVMAWVGGANRFHLHPAAQSNQYRLYLEGSHEAFYGDSPVLLDSCAYLHNYRIENTDPLFAPQYQGFLRYSPVFGEGEVERLSKYLKTRLERGKGLPILERIRNAKYGPSKKLMQNASKVIQAKSEYVLLDEQKLIYDRILARVRSSETNHKKSVFIIKGGPGTGKSVIALNLVADLLRSGKLVHHATGSKAFTETLWHVLGPKYKQFFRYFNDYRVAASNQLDILVTDEAHRIRATSDNWRTPRAKRTGQPQIEELLNAGRITVFFLDDRQMVRPDEMGSSEYIQQAAKRAGAEVESFQLEVQFRCGGSDAFVSWVENTLAIKETAHQIWKGDENFDFRIVDSPQEADELIRRRLHEGFTGRMVAGFCWPWSDPRTNGTLVEDVQVAGYSRPWNAKPNAGRLAPGVPPAPIWATDPRGVDQVGCIYTAQGFEFDYAGVIFGDDLVWRKDHWVADKKRSADSVVKRSGERFEALVRQTYRVLLSRGMKGCYVYFTDQETRTFFQNRMSIRNPR